MHRADMALYAAKRTGRNRVVMVQPGQSIPDAVEQDPRGSMNIPFTTPPEKPQSSVVPIDVPALPLERLRSG
jgi:hypothetical protein